MAGIVLVGATLFSRLLQDLLILLATVLALLWIASRLLQALKRHILCGMPNVQSVAFVHELRDLVFRNPVAFMSRLWADDRQAFVRQL